MENILNYDYKLYVLFIENGVVEIFNETKDFQKKSTQQNIISEDNTAIMLHTSGTTNNPKRVMLRSSCKLLWAKSWLNRHTINLHYIGRDGKNCVKIYR